jgi:LysR family transcriptional regulator, hydrogen peroxide-inducible genes activator
MEMHQVRYFLAVAEELNFTRASEKCNVTQPSLSRGIKLLEDELGGPLFHRDREHTHLTDLGQIVRPHLQSVLDHSKFAKQLSQDFVHKVPLKLGIMSTISPHEIVDLIANLRSRHPDVGPQAVRCECQGSAFAPARRRSRSRHLRTAGRGAR